MLDFGKPFVNLCLDDGSIRVTLTDLAKTWEPIDLSTKAQPLLDREVSIAQTDSLGRNCLHIAIKEVYTRDLRTDWFEFLVFLISRGAEVDAIDDRGM
jgi:hypothetical protein